MPGLRSATTPAEAAAIEASVKAALLAYARAKGISDPIVRDLIPGVDLKGAFQSGELWTQSVSAMNYATVYSGKNDDDRGFALFKVANKRGAPLTCSIKFFHGTAKTALKDIWQVEATWLEEDVQSYCDPAHVVFYGVSEEYNIDLMAGLRGGVDNVILGGKVVEPRGKTVTPKTGGFPASWE